MFWASFPMLMYNMLFISHDADTYVMHHVTPMPAPSCDASAHANGIT